jgi:glutaredoxin-related protein
MAVTWRQWADDIEITSVISKLKRWIKLADSSPRQNWLREKSEAGTGVVPASMR